MKYHVERSILIDAPLSKIHDTLKDFSTWESWSPWSVCDPGHKNTLSGKAGEVGHKMSWDSEIIGSGEQEISSISARKIDTELRFFKPFKSTAKAALKLSEEKGKSKVTWTMDSSMPFFLFWMIKPMKNWIGMDYERGLTMLKALIEEGKIKARTTNEGIKDYEGFNYVGIKRTCHYKDMPNAMSEDFKELMGTVMTDMGKCAKHWICLYPKVSMRSMQFTYVAAISAEELDGLELPKHWIRGSVPSQKMLEVKHAGSYRFLGNAWSMIMSTVRAKKMGTRRAVPFEQYWNSPTQVSEDELLTSIFFPVK